MRAQVGAFSEYCDPQNCVNSLDLQCAGTAGDHPPDELGGVVEGPPELDLGGVARHAAHDVHALVLGHAVDDGLRCCTNRNI